MNVCDHLYDLLDGLCFVSFRVQRVLSPLVDAAVKILPLVNAAFHNKKRIVLTKEREAAQVFVQ